MKKKSNMQFLFWSMGPFKIALFLSIVFSAISAVENIYAFTFVYKITDHIVACSGDMQAVDASSIIQFGKQLIFAVCAAYGFYGIALLFSHITAFNTIARMKNMLIEHIGRLPSGYHDTNASGSIRKIIEKNTDSTETLMAHQIPNTAQSIVLPITFGIFMFRYSVWLSIACLIPVIIGFILMMMIMAGNGSDFVRKYQQSSKDMSNAAVEYVRGIPVMKTFGQTADSFKRYKNAVEGFCEYVMKFALSMMTADSLYNTAMNCVFYTLIPAAIILFNKGGNTAKVISSFVFFASIIPMEVTILKRMMGNSSESIIVDEAIGSLRTILDEKVMEYRGNEIPKAYDIRFEGVSFRYAETLPLAIQQMDLAIPKGKTLALVGLSGGGKSTVASLSARLRDVTEGAVKIGGIDVRMIPEKALNDCVSIVFQENSLLKMSIADNVALYKKDASREEILRALELAQCKDIIEKLPEGIDTQFGSQGVYLSGGEVQRIAIARAILKDSPIIILDEATAFADAENEYLIRKAFKELLKDKTVIMIAHRMSTVKDADKICVIADGQVVEEGTHTDLMARQGKYAGMVNEYRRAVNWTFERSEKAV